jgi:hypothetical protein
MRLWTAAPPFAKGRNYYPLRKKRVGNPMKAL